MSKPIKISARQLRVLVKEAMGPMPPPPQSANHEVTVLVKCTFDATDAVIENGEEAVVSALKKKLTAALYEFDGVLEVVDEIQVNGATYPVSPGRASF